MFSAALKNEVKDKGGALLFAASLGLLAYVFLWPLQNLLGAWAQDEYSHGYLLPPIALLMGLHRLATRKPRAEASWWGCAVFLFSLLFLFVGFASSSRHFTFLGLWLSFLSLSLATFGRKVTAILLPAFVFLLFCVPLPTEVFNRLSLDMRLLSSDIGVALLQALGVSVFQNGNVIDLGTTKLEVVDACNGLRYVFPLISLSFLFAYMYQASWWRRSIIFLSSLPIAVVMNATRIASIGLAVNYWGPSAAEGLVHELHGLLVFMGSFALLWGEAALFRLWGERGKIDLDLFSLPRGPFLAAPLAVRTPGIALFVLLFLATGLIASDTVAPRSPKIPVVASWDAFPLTLEPWRGTSIKIDPETLKVLNPTDYAQINFERAKEPGTVNFYVAFYAAQKMDAVLHAPTNCLPGSGWVIDSETEKLFSPNPADGTPFFLARLRVRSGEQKQIVYYWFVQQGEPVTSQVLGRWKLFVHSLFSGRADGNLVRFVTPVLPTETEAEADERLETFLRLAFPTLRTFLPQKDP